MKTIFTLWAAVFLAATALSQVPEKMSYQAVIRNSSGQLVQNSQVGMKISILQGSSSGTPLYSETHTPTTNANGLVTLQIGNGNSTDDFSLIDWKGGPFFIQTETDPSGGTNYIITGTSQLLSVPFALYAKVAENVPGGMAETDPVFTAWDKSSGISIMESQVSDLKDYLITETDPEFDNSVAAGITQADTAAWNAASVGAYIETDPVFGAHVVSSITGADISSWNNKLDTEVDGSVTNELQDLQISGNILSLSDDTSPVDLSVYLDNTDNQQLTIFGDSLGIENGNRVDLSTINYWQQTGSDIFYQAGKVGIATINPSQSLEVADTIYSSMGGFKFPDGTVQSTAASGAGVASIDDLSDGRTIGYSVFLGSGTGINDDGTNNFNAGLGIDALTSNTSGYSNTAMGYQPLYSNTTGHGNTAIGNYALYSNTGGYGNIATGYRALYSNTSGRHNTASGYGALASNTSGDLNTANGFQALGSNTTGQSNTANGYQALNTNTEGQDNTASGLYALFANSTGKWNTANGSRALHSNTTGNSNVGLGYSANRFNRAGSQNTILGYEAGRGPTIHDKSGNVFLGYQAGYYEVGDNKLYIENSNDSLPLIWGDFGADSIRINGSLVVTGNIHGVAPGSVSSIDDLSDGRTTGYSVFLGTAAGMNDDGTDNYNVALGNSALSSNTSGYNNTALGYRALASNTNGYCNTANGYRALYSNSTGTNNTAMGRDALYTNSVGLLNTAIGNNALFFNTNNSNTAIGNHALRLNTTGFRNTAVGDGALSFNLTGTRNTAIGTYAGPLYDNLINTTALGYYSRTYSDNTIQLGNADITQIGGYAAWSNLSDGRFKVHVKPNVPGLDFIMKLRPVTFNWDLQGLENFQGSNEDEFPKSDELEKAKTDKEKKIYTGFIAQEVEKAATDCGFDFSGIIRPTTSKSTYHLSYAEFVVPLVKALQEQQKQIEEQHKRIETLVQEIEQLKK